MERGSWDFSWWALHSFFVLLFGLVRGCGKSGKKKEPKSKLVGLPSASAFVGMPSGPLQQIEAINFLGAGQTSWCLWVFSVYVPRRVDARKDAWRDVVYVKFGKLCRVGRRPFVGSKSVVKIASRRVPLAHEARRRRRWILRSPSHCCDSLELKHQQEASIT